MAVLDSFSFGLPVITTPVGGIPDMLTNSVNALIFEAGDVGALSKCLERCMNDSHFRHSLSDSFINWLRLFLT
ncbi:hypothetical protein CWM47_36635 [Spirosoma pollinicola]|uniref:Glycosyl transferase family 1 domain-containing protein n=2 Tax=Spirosoma pollinicola TaxID=2057025 RepID=A0A2K8ZAP6_9BACT|nr:hypothetical protein CWM47_36635 [Spirosoma pollinicola]